LPADVALYNRAAIEVMQEAGIEVNDLYARVLTRLKELQMPVNVHFTNAGSEELARFVAAAIEARLPGARP
jgi:acyl-CoA thioesterase-1